MSAQFQCRSGCGVCCIVPSISSSIPGMTKGKPAGKRCAQLTLDDRCRLFGSDERPQVCRSLRPHLEMCGRNKEEALRYWMSIEEATKPEQEEQG